MNPRVWFPRLLLGVAIAGAAAWMALHPEYLDPAAIERAVDGLGAWAPLGHVGVSVPFFPKVPVAIADYFNSLPEAAESCLVLFQ